MGGGKFDWCPYLVDGTGKQQHDFEERKAVFPTAAGLLLYAAKSSSPEQMNLPVLGGGLPIKQVTRKVTDLIKSFLP